jgi:hypothetical protein
MPDIQSRTSARRPVKSAALFMNFRKSSSPSEIGGARGNGRSPACR